MSTGEFKKFIESIGFKYDGYSYLYKEYRIDLYPTHYYFFNGSKGSKFLDLNDLKPIEDYFKNELRSIKLKKILS